MKWIKLFEEFQMGDLNFMSPEGIQWLFMRECEKETPDLELIKVILDNGLVDVNAEYSEGESPLHKAVREDNIALAELLISAGANVNAKYNYERSLLHVAVRRDNIALVELLISAGADVDSKDYFGNSPLRVAVERGNIEMQDLLKKNGATL